MHEGEETHEGNGVKASASTAKISLQFTACYSSACVASMKCFPSNG